uniref:Uncharacterized protein n=1 Tax=Eutreptiella gymnastica TaxID=73025 RepID=A0A7S4GPB5_9EUGL|mmetsp:Transcript_78045/g.131096  ORF Transcript_78045/g.131096 Transcript_78045/m.131096 type:complete len:126 (+) Transcript_78045:374-751(+)
MSLSQLLLLSPFPVAVVPRSQLLSRLLVADHSALLVDSHPQMWLRSLLLLRDEIEIDPILTSAVITGTRVVGYPNDLPRPSMAVKLECKQDEHLVRGKPNKRKPTPSQKTQRRRWTGLALPFHVN